MRAEFIRLLSLTLTAPKQGAAAVLQHHYSNQLLWSLLALATVVSVLMVQVMRFAFPPPEEVIAVMPFQSSPVLFALIMWGSLVLVVFCVYHFGRAFGGKGSFHSSLTVVIWMQVLLMVSQVVQFLLALLSLSLAGLLGLAFIVYWIWIFATMVGALHQFDNRGIVLGGMLISMIGLMMGLSLLTTFIAILFGVELPNA